MPLARRLPKRGFKNPFREEYVALNVGLILGAFEGKLKYPSKTFTKEAFAKKALS